MGFVTFLNRGGLRMKQAIYRDLHPYKYQLLEDYSVSTPITGHTVLLEDTGYIALDTDGTITIKARYAWDGASSCPDFNSILRGSLVHDAFYQLFRMEKLPISLRDKSDRLIQTMCKEDGMNSLLAATVYRALKWFGANAAKPGTQPKEKRKRAPKVAR